MADNKNIHRFGNIIVEYFPSDKDTVACYQLRDISNDRRVEWDEGTSMYVWIETWLKELKTAPVKSVDNKPNYNKVHEYIQNSVLLILHLATDWTPTPTGLNEMIQVYINDVKRLHPTKKISEGENQKIINEEKKAYDTTHKVK